MIQTSLVVKVDSYGLTRLPTLPDYPLDTLGLVPRARKVLAALSNRLGASIETRNMGVRSILTGPMVAKSGTGYRKTVAAVIVLP